MKQMSLVIALLVARVALGAPDNKDVARQAFAEGQRHYDLNEFGPALEAFRRAYLAYEDPAFLFNIAQCYRQLDNKSEAIKFYRSYLRKMTNAPNRDEVRTLIASLESAVEQEKAQAASPPQTREPLKPITAPTAAAPSGTPQLVESKQRGDERRPAYKKWWVWTIVGVAAAGAAAGLAVGLTSEKAEPTLMPVTVSR